MHAIWCRHTVMPDAHMLVPSCTAHEARDIFCTKTMRGLEGEEEGWRQEYRC